MKEIIKKLKELSLKLSSNCQSYTSGYIDGIDLAIETIKDNIVKVDKSTLEGESTYFKMTSCTKCDNLVLEEANYCFECGSKIEWY